LSKRKAKLKIGTLNQVFHHNFRSLKKNKKIKETDEGEETIE